MKALYRRYRPKTLSEVVGQETITDVLSRSIKSGKIAHAYLFIGPRGTGKTSVARIFAHEINSFDYQLEDDYLDIIEIDAASNTGVDNIRELREKAIIAPTKGKYKVYIIDEVHMLSKSAFNALLKTLEEPPEHVIFIMATTDAYKIPVTITSRSQVFTFKLADAGTMLEHLKKVAKTEKIKIDDDALELIVRRGGGSFRDTLSLLDQVSTLTDEKITSQLLISALGLPQRDTMLSILSAYAAGDTNRIRAELQGLLDSGLKPEVIADELISEILENPQPIHLGLLDKLTDVSRNAYPNVRLLLALMPMSAQAAPVFSSTPMSTQKPVTPAPIPTPTPTQIPKPAQKPIPPKPEEPAESTGPVAPKPEKPAPEPAQKSAAKSKSLPSDADAAEIWNQILLQAEKDSPGNVRYLNNANYAIENQVITVYVGNNKFAKIQLEKRVSVLAEVLPEGYSLKITEGVMNQDADIAAIAELMGGGEEVQIDA